MADKIKLSTTKNPELSLFFFFFPLKEKQNSTIMVALEGVKGRQVNSLLQGKLCAIRTFQGSCYFVFCEDTSKNTVSKNIIPENLKLICLPSKKLLNATSHPYSCLRSQNH